MQHLNNFEKIKSRKSLQWHEEGQGRKGDKRNKTVRDRSLKRAEVVTD